MKKYYEAPTAEIEKFSLLSSVTTSTGLDDNPNEDIGEF